MKTHVSHLTVMLTVAICLVPAYALAARAQTIQVRGSMQEVITQFALTAHGITATGTDTWTGTLAGDGTCHIFSSDNDLTKGATNVISSRILFTSDGSLFLSELGANKGGSVRVVSTVVRGTGKFKNATGELLLQGLHTDTGVQFRYSGSITLTH